jgi:hypothetical protein
MTLTQHADLSILEEQLRDARAHILKLEESVARAPSAMDIVELNAAKEVAGRLEEQVRKGPDTPPGNTIRRAAQGAGQNYDAAATALGRLLKSSDAANEIQTELRAVANELDKSNVSVTRPDTFWPRHRALRDRFTDSVFRNRAW